MGTFRALCRRGHPARVDQTQASFLAQISPTLGGCVPSSLQSRPLHGGKRSSPERYRQEGQRGQGWPGRRWQVLGHHTLGNPEIGISVPGHTCLSVLIMWSHYAPVVSLVLITYGETEAQGGAGSCLRSHGLCLDSFQVCQVCMSPVLGPSAHRWEAPAMLLWRFLRAHFVPCCRGRLCCSILHPCSSEHLPCAPRHAGGLGVPPPEVPTVCFPQLGL